MRVRAVETLLRVDLDLRLGPVWRGKVTALISASVLCAPLVIAYKLVCGLVSSGTDRDNAFGTGRKYHPREDNLSEHRGGRSSTYRRETAATAMTDYTDLIFCTSDNRCG
jgi:hypothetical protein